MAKLRFFASVKEKMGVDMMEMPVLNPIMMRDLLTQAAKEADVDPSVLINNSLLYAVNQEATGLDHKIEDSDEVAVLPPLSGGAN